MIKFETVRALWFMPVKLNRSDWLAALCNENGQLILRWRMRYYRDDKITDSKDEKRWYEARGKAEST